MHRCHFTPVTCQSLHVWVISYLWCAFGSKKNCRNPVVRVRRKNNAVEFFWFWVRFCAAADVGVCIVCTSWRKHVKMFAFWGMRTMHSKIMCGAFLFRRDFAKHIAHGKIWCGMANVCMWCEAPMDMFNWFMFVMRFCWTFFYVCGQKTFTPLCIFLKLKKHSRKQEQSHHGLHGQYESVCALTWCVFPKFRDRIVFCLGKKSK